MRKALFLDRDGTLVVDTGYLSDPAKLAFLPGVEDTLREAQESGYLLVTISNQSGIGRGLITEADYQSVQEAVLRWLGDHGVMIAGSYFCPHTPGDDCECRKPNPGLILRAAQELAVDLSCSILIGDKRSDIAAGEAAGCKTILINRKQNEEDAQPVLPDWEFQDWEQLRRSRIWEKIDQGAGSR